MIHLLEVERYVERTGKYVYRACCGTRRTVPWKSLPYDYKDTDGVDGVTCGGCKRSIKYKSLKDEWYVIEKRIKKQFK